MLRGNHLSQGLVPLSHHIASPQRLDAASGTVHNIIVIEKIAKIMDTVIREIFVCKVMKFFYAKTVYL